MRKVTKRFVEKEAVKMTGEKHGSKGHRVACILMAAPIIGAFDGKIARFLGLRITDVTPVAMVLRRNGIFFKDGTVAASEWLGKDGGVAFNLDVAVGLGFLKKVSGAKPKSTTWENATKRKAKKS